MRTVGSSLATYLEPFTHRRNVPSLSLFYSYYFDICSSELAELVPLPFSWVRSTHYSERLHNVSVTISRCYKDVYLNSFFPCTATINFIIFWDFSTFYQTFLSPQVKQWAIITYKHGIYQLPHKLPNDLTLRILWN